MICASPPMETVDETTPRSAWSGHLTDARELYTMLGLIQNDLFDLGRRPQAVPKKREGKERARTRARTRARRQEQGPERLRVLSSRSSGLGADIDSLNASYGL